MTIYALDTESTGLKNHPIHGHPQCIELAAIHIDNDLKKLHSLSLLLDEESLFSGFVKDNLNIYGKVARYRPSMEIDKRAIEVHGITFKQLLGLPRSEDLKLPEDIKYLVAHNAQFDYRVLGKPSHIKCFCTLTLARKLDKKLGIGFKNHKLDTLILHFYGEKAQPLIDNSHQALTDTVKVILLLVKLLDFIPAIETFDELYEFQETLRRLK